MRFGKKWIAISMTAALLAANLTAPATALTVMADEAAFEEDFQTDGEDGLFADDRNEESDAVEAVSDLVEMSETSAEGWEDDSAAEISGMNESNTNGSADAAALPVEAAAETEDSTADGTPAGTADSVNVEVSDQIMEDSSQETESSADSALVEMEQDEINTTIDPVNVPDSAGTGGETFYTDPGDSEDSTEAASSDMQDAEGESALTDDGTLTDPDREIFLTDDSSTDDSLTDDSSLEVEEVVPDGLLITEEGISETYIPVEDGIEYSDNEDVFAAYVNRELGLDGDLKADTGDYYVSEPRKKSHYASRNLTGNNLTVYALLLKQIKEVAAGNRTDTVFTVSLEDLGLQDKTWTAEDLGVDAIAIKDPDTGNYSIAADAKTAIYTQLGISFKTVNKALLADCPYDLYWYDKTTGSASSGFGLSGSTSGGVWKLYFTGEYTFEFPVAMEYSVAGEEDTYVTDPSKGQAVQTACRNALEIVNRYSERSDYEKLDGYRKEICALTSYNNDAADDSTNTPYGNPWQLIWTFDGDDSTKVVCEGYAKSFQYLCDLSSWNSIFKECISVTGSMGGGTGAGGHMWNIVTLRDNRNYLVDITNCDSGTIGAGNNGRNLFLVGTGDSSSSEVYAQGNVSEGYTFAKLGNLYYIYDSTSLERFGTTILTLSSGRVNSSTTATGEYTGSHDHIYLPVEAKAATCTEEGHSEGEQCVICGEINPKTTSVIEKTPHTPGTWNVRTSPSYDEPGEEYTYCTVCNEELTREIPALVSESDITLNYEQLSLKKGEVKTVTATVLPSDAYDKTVTWSSDNKSVATVTSEGKITAIGNGTTTIKAVTEHLGLAASCEVTVTTPVSGISVSQTEASMEKGETLALSANVSPADASDQTVTWTSSEPEIASVSEKGLVTAVSGGSAKISAKTADGGFTAACQINVIVPLESVTLPEEQILVKRDETVKIEYQLVPADTTEKEILWSSDDQSVAVAENGSITGIGSGTANVTASRPDGTLLGDCRVRVIVPVEKCKLDAASIKLWTGDSRDIHYSIVPAEFSEGINWKYEYDDYPSAYSGQRVFEVRGIEGGAEIKALAPGTGKITYTLETETGKTYTASCSVEVLQEISSFTVNQSALSLTVGDKQDLSAKVLPEDASGRVVSWTSSNEKIIKVTPADNGSLDLTAQNTASIEAVSCGTATVQAKITEETRNGSVTHTEICRVTVNPVQLDKVLSEDKKTSGVEIASDGKLVYTGSALKPAVTVTCNGKILKKDVDYTVSYKNNTAAGNAKAVITGCGSYTGTFEKIFTIRRASQTVKASNVTKTYGDGDFTLDAKSNGDGKLSFKSDNVATAVVNRTSGLVKIKGTGKAVITITAEETPNYSASADKNITITVNPRKIIDSGVSVAPGSYTYSGSAHTPAVTVKSNNITLKKDTDYKLTYGSNTNAGSATVTVEGIGNYNGKVIKNFTIAPASQNIKVKAAAASIPVGKTTKVSISGAKGKITFTSSNTSVATVSKTTGIVTAKKVGTVKIKAASAASPQKNPNYKAASKTVTIKVLPAATKKITAVNQAKGIKLTWAEVEDANGYIIYRNNKKVKTITGRSTVTWADPAANTNGTKYTYKVVAKASTGTSTLSKTVTTYKIARPAIRTLKNSASKKMKVTWAKNAKSTGYQIQYALNSTFTSGLKKVSITKAATVSKTIGSLTKGKKYYVRIRTVKKVGKVTCYSAWSPVKFVKISK